jgi:hypothetical protein
VGNFGFFMNLGFRTFYLSGNGENFPAYFFNLAIVYFGFQVPPQGWDGDRSLKPCSESILAHPGAIFVKIKSQCNIHQPLGDEPDHDEIQLQGLCHVGESKSFLGNAWHKAWHSWPTGPLAMSPEEFAHLRCCVCCQLGIRDRRTNLRWLNPGYLL